MTSGERIRAWVSKCKMRGGGCDVFGAMTSGECVSEYDGELVRVEDRASEAAPDDEAQSSDSDESEADVL